MHIRYPFLPIAAICLAILGMAACTPQATPKPALGGTTTIADHSPNAFSFPAPGLSPEQELFFQVGNSFFHNNWVTAPASTTARDGLGPLLNATSCAGCHHKDGRGAPMQADSHQTAGFLVRLSVPGYGLHYQPLPEPNYGLQLQVLAIADVPVEGQVQIHYSEQSGSFADGTAYSLRVPTYQIENLAYGELATDALFSPRVAPQMIGLGLLDAVPTASLLALADPTDTDGDGISGRPNWVWDAYNQQMAIGRFGWKANQPHMLQQVAGAFNGDLGVTSALFLTDPCTPSQNACLHAPNGGEPEIESDDLLKVVLYSSALAVPAQRDAQNAQVLQGERLFTQIGCSSCHMPILQSAIHPTIPTLSNQTFAPYTDLLLHDMGAGLADGRPDFQATGLEWRTPPLWGIGLFETVNGHTFYLHDGRARNLAEAILWHGGEAQAARDWFARLPAAEREALLAFLRSL